MTSNRLYGIMLKQIAAALWEQGQVRPEDIEPVIAMTCAWLGRRYGRGTWKSINNAFLPVIEQKRREMREWLP